MADYRLLYDSDYLYAFHLQGKEATVKIAKVSGGKLKDKDGKESRKPFVWFAGKTKPLALNKTNGSLIADLYGKDTANWIGKLVTLFPTTTQAFGKIHDCIRIKPSVPKGGESSGSIDENAEGPELPEPGSDGE